MPQSNAQTGLFSQLASLFTTAYWQNKAANGEIVDVASCNDNGIKVAFNALSNIAGFSNITNGITCDNIPLTNINLIDKREAAKKSVALVLVSIILVVAIIVVVRK